MQSIYNKICVYHKALTIELNALNKLEYDILINFDINSYINIYSSVYASSSYITKIYKKYENDIDITNINPQDKLFDHIQRMHSEIRKMIYAHDMTIRIIDYMSPNLEV